MCASYSIGNHRALYKDEAVTSQCKTSECVNDISITNRIEELDKSVSDTSFPLLNNLFNKKETYIKNLHIRRNISKEVKISKFIILTKL